MKKSIAGIFLFLTAIITVLFFFQKGIPKEEKYVASVEGEGITYNELNKFTLQYKNFLAWTNATPSASLEKDILNNLIDQKLIDQYARKNNIYVSDEELNTRYSAAVASLGTENQYLTKIKEIYGIDKTDLLEKIKNEMIREKVQKSMNVSLEDWLKQERINKKVVSYLF